MNAKRSLCLIANLTFIALPAVFAQSYDLRPRFREGQSWSFEQTGEMQQNAEMSAPGQPPQQMQQTMRQKRTGTVTVLAVNDGLPVSVRVAFGNDCSTEMEMAGQRQTIPVPFAGQAVTITRDARGQISHDFKAQADPMALAELNNYLSVTRESFPPKPVAVGDEWEPDTAAMRQAYQMGAQDRLSVKCRLVSIQELAGRRCAEIETTSALAKRQGDTEMQNDMRGTSLVELDTGNTLHGEMTGTSTFRGPQQQGRGTSRMQLTARPLELAAPVAGAPPRPDTGTYAGAFECREMTVTLTGSGESFTGTIEMNGQKYPVTARVVAGRLDGTFTSGGDKFPFTATLDGPAMKLESGGATYTLGRKAGNPLAAPPAAKPNPLAGPRSQATPATQPAPLAAGQAGIVRFKKVSVQDRPEGIGGEAFTFLCPVDWTVEGGLIWREHPAMPATVHLRAFKPGSLEQLESIPTLGFSWGGMLQQTGFQPGSLYYGNEVRPPVRDAAQYINEIILPRYRQNVQFRVAGAQEMPEWGQAVAGADELQQLAMTGVQASCSAGKVRIEYEVGGQPVEEDFYVALVTTVMSGGMAPMYLQSGERVHAMRAAKGQLDAATKIMQTMVTSTRPNPQWFSKYSQLCATLHNIEMGKIRTAGKISQIISQTSNEISDMQMESWNRKNASEDRISKAWSQVNRGVEEYYNPVEQRPVELPSGYRNAWVNGAGEYVVTDSESFNPNVELNGSWQKLQRAGN